MLRSAPLATLLALIALQLPAQHTPLPKPTEPPPPPTADLPGATTAVRLPAADLARDHHLVNVMLPHGALISAPDTWRLTNQPNGAIAIAPRRAAGTFGISYGVLIGTTPDNATSPAALTTAPSAVTDHLLRQILQNPRLKPHNLKPQPGTSTFQVAGQPALSRELTGTSPIADSVGPLQEHAWLITLPRPDGTLAYLLFIAPEPDFARLQPLFDTMLTSYKPQ